MTEHRELFQQLDTLCQQVTPYLKGDVARNDATMLIGEMSDLAVIKQLYRAIQSDHPEAGPAYWLTRTWDMLCWQPIYISMIAIYGMKVLPSFEGFSQKKHGAYVMGFQFQTIKFTTDAETERLIEFAGAQLTKLFSHYRMLLASWLRCRPGFVSQIFADALLANIIKMKEVCPELEAIKVIQHSKWWLSSCGLPLGNLRSFATNNDGAVLFKRRSCCLVYKTEGGERCANCPRIREPLCTN
ncbi:siderophore ferric iron reductase [Vibrio algarum]|uniref:Siderophore ferric iron reductase n=1 Tax=Vibrio algarum TaxID=3020714 RepID=A0ABT4YVU8_9VIBR|nr:siderophore ferric iron reductase [Vibrio sp. KJ40-1]MDB1125705.1 siderophore ferric iron reductase [Vibrio sp. KJ40-1]